ncbi:Tyrosine recombinase XerC [Vibrio stylophorae]|uniref:Tyrosine recombinase XerC n=1 Tax=Vibrio stylophorae TaxID=659351 RepID=A0ABM8ZRQ5_9VIBR|nr:DUF6538 domain-containing protein [Vibrio stylophorae]CAH0532785.1 Tyrosine recombinase XerC [Vibrio stylophorae]
MHLYRRGKSGIYYYQRRIPASIKQFYNNKIHIKFSLKTNNSSEAKRIASLHSARLAVEFEQYESSLKTSSPTPLAKLSNLALITANSWLATTKDLAQQVEDKPDHIVDMFLKGLDEERYLFATTSADLKNSDSDKQLKLTKDGLWTSVLASMSSEQKSLVATLPLEQKVKLFQLISRYTHPLSLKLQQEMSQLYPDLAIIRPYELSKEAPLLVDAFNQFLDNKHSEKPMSLKLEQRYTSALESLSALIGKDCPLNSINRTHIRELRTLLSKLPANIKKKPETRALSLSEIYNLVREDSLSHLPSLSITSVNQRLEALHAFFQFCIQESWMSINPAEKIRLQKTVANKDKRFPYPIELLDKLLNLTKGTKHYWTVRLGLCGLRMNEIVQLTPADIRQSPEGIWYIDVNKDDGKAVKNLSSIRQVPIPNSLLKLGFVTFAKESKTETLFDVPTSKATGYRSDIYSKRYANFTRKQELKEDKVTFHSLRHNFKDYALSANIPEAAFKQIAGWTDDSVSAAYGSGYTLMKLTEYMNLLPFPSSY